MENPSFAREDSTLGRRMGAGGRSGSAVHCSSPLVASETQLPPPTTR